MVNIDERRTCIIINKLFIFQQIFLKTVTWSKLARKMKNLLTNLTTFFSLISIYIYIYIYIYICGGTNVTKQRELELIVPRFRLIVPIHVVLLY